MHLLNPVLDIRRCLAQRSSFIPQPKKRRRTSRERSGLVLLALLCVAMVIPTSRTWIRSQLEVMARPLGIAVETAPQAMSRDAGLGAALLAYVLPVMTAVSPILNIELTLWLQGRSGRKVRLRFGEVEAEASTIAELDELLSRAKAYQDSIGAQANKFQD